MYQLTYSITFGSSTPTRNALVLLPCLYSLTSFIIAWMILIKSKLQLSLIHI